MKLTGNLNVSITSHEHCGKHVSRVTLPVPKRISPFFFTSSNKQENTLDSCFQVCKIKGGQQRIAPTTRQVMEKSLRGPRKQASPSVSRRQPVFHVIRGSGVASGTGWRQAASPPALTWDFFQSNSSRKQHDDAAISQASPLERPKSEEVPPPSSSERLETSQITAKSPSKPSQDALVYAPDIIRTTLAAASLDWWPNCPIFLTRNLLFVANQETNRDNCSPPSHKDY